MDGRATIQGRAGPIGTRDRHWRSCTCLRTQVDAVMIGAGTMRAECYGRIVPDPELRGHRERVEGLAHDPLAVIVTRTLDLPWDCGLFSGGWGRVLDRRPPSDEEIPDVATSTRVVRFEDRVDLAELLRVLRNERGVRSLLCEGGPHTHAQLVELELIDELFVTLAPKLAGGSGPGLLEGALEQQRPLEPVWLCEDEPASSTRATEWCAATRPAEGQAGGIRPCSSTRRSPRRSIRSARIVPPRMAASPKLTWTLSTPSRVQ